MIARGFEEARAHYPLISPPGKLYLTAADFGDLAARYPGADWMAAVAEAGDGQRGARTLAVDWVPAEPMQRSVERLKTHLASLGANGIHAVILCDNAGQRDRLWELLGETGATLGVGLVSAGFTLRAAGLRFLADREIFARYRRRRRRLKRTGGLSLAELSALKVGDFVVHEDHGIGIYRGMKRLTLNGQETDCVEIGYAENDRLFVPVQQLALVSRYAAGEGARPALYRLGSGSWAKTKARAKRAIQEMADGLVKAYAARKALPGHAFKPDTVWQRELEASFPYDETPDQLKAIVEVKEDMEQPRPMDRLICGDVGYGKTEVAIRAAFKAVQDGRQVAVLVPTTILAQQHLLTFRERLAGFPVRVEVLSRFRTPREQKLTLAALAEGKVDIVIGTHRLLSKDVKYAALGLVIIDEEHRFGAGQKEKPRKITRPCDVLVSTMIIESGLDITSVNTLIVDRADTLGLAQLYQLRGRVGRSSHRAYAYLLVPSRRVLTEEAEKRLRVIEEFDDLGAGFKIALKDLEIRGAGNLLGPEQHGFILGLGFDLYVKLLEEAVAEVEGEMPEHLAEPRLLTDWSGFLPDDYVHDEHDKLNLYRRLAEPRSLDELDDLTLEMLDRFGQLPPPAVALFELRRLRLLGAGPQVEALRVFQQVAELGLRQPLTPAAIRTVVGMLGFQIEFFSGREFGLRVRGEGLLLLNRTRELLEALETAQNP